MTIDTKNSDEIIQATFDYASEIGAGVNIASTLLAVTVAEGVDGTPATLLQGGPQIAANEVRQLLKAGVDDVLYKVRCLATLSDGRKLARTLVLRVVAP